MNKLAYDFLKEIGHNWSNGEFDDRLYYIKEAIEHGFKIKYK